MKTKLGISVGVLGAFSYFAALFGGYLTVFILLAYVLLREENEWLKKTVIKATVAMVSFSVLIAAVNLIPDLLSWIDTVASVFGDDFEYGTFSLIIRAITKAIEIFRTVIFLVLGAKALNQGTMKVPFVDTFMDRHFGA